MVHKSDEESRFLAAIHQQNYDLCVAKDCFGLPPIEIFAVFWVGTGHQFLTIYRGVGSIKGGGGKEKIFPS
jgi:hypothetical protein